MHLVVALCCDTKLDKYTNAMYTACTVPFRPCIDEQHTHKHLCVCDACDWVWAHVRLIKVLFNMQLHSPTEYQLRVATSPSRHYFFVFVLLHSMQWHVLIHTCTQSHGAMKQTGASQSIDTQSVWYVFALCCGHSDTFSECFFVFYSQAQVHTLSVTRAGCLSCWPASQTTGTTTEARANAFSCGWCLARSERPAVVLCAYRQQCEQAAHVVHMHNFYRRLYIL